MSARDDFLAWHARLNHSPHTVKAYGRALDRLAQILPNFDTADRRAVREAARRVLDGAPATYNQALSALKGFYTWAVEEAEIRVDNPIAGMRSAKRPQRQPKPVDDDIVARLLTAPDDSPQSRRDTAIVATLLATGLRRSELCALDVDDAGGDEIRVIGKGDKERLVLLDRRARRALDRYLACRGLLRPACAALFIGRGGERLGPRGVECLLVRRGRGVHVTPHQLRHTFATTAVRRAMPIEKVQLLMGHRSIDTTMIYTQVASADLRRSYKEAMGD
jgi:integrase/recombinase XerC